jgi:ribosomal protein S20
VLSSPSSLLTHFNNYQEAEKNSITIPSTSSATSKVVAIGAGKEGANKQPVKLIEEVDKASGKGVLAPSAALEEVSNGNAHVKKEQGGLFDQVMNNLL